MAEFIVYAGFILIGIVCPAVGVVYGICFRDWLPLIAGVSAFVVEGILIGKGCGWFGNKSQEKESDEPKESRLDVAHRELNNLLDLSRLFAQRPHGFKPGVTWTTDNQVYDDPIDMLPPKPKTAFEMIMEEAERKQPTK